MKQTREQTLVDICFQLVLVATDDRTSDYFKNKTNDEKAEWVRERLRGCGFNVSDPVGSSWGVLVNER